MNTKDYFKDIYTDFFGVEDYNINNSEKRDSQEEMASLFERINNLYINEDSKNLLKQIIEYMRKYNEKIENNYIPFNIIIEVNNALTKDEIEDIIFQASKNYSYISDKKITKISLYDTKNIEINTGVNAIYNLKGITLFDIKEQEILYNKIEEAAKKNQNKIITITGNKDELKNFFLGHENLKNNYFEFTLIGKNPDVQDIYEYVLNKVELDDENKIKLLDYITNSYDETIDFEKYRNDLIKYISFNKKIPELEKEKSLDEIFESLNELVGLKKVKKVLYELVDVIKLREKTDLKLSNLNLHMVFLGNPGTGKTTIARTISSILYNLHYIKEDKLIEVSSKDLVAEYVGQTAPKTMSVINKSLNGVLFIDEAYSLAVKNDNSYNAEAIATLIQAMENYRDKLVVIFAGYTKEMQDFLNSNSGITSRIGYTLEFEDYTTDELIEIFMGSVKKSGFEIEDEAINYLRQIIDENRNTKNFGNARFVRNIFEKTVIKHASNVKDKKQKKILKTITKNDISIENLIF